MVVAVSTPAMPDSGESSGPSRADRDQRRAESHGSGDDPEHSGLCPTGCATESGEARDGTTGVHVDIDVHAVALKPLSLRGELLEARGSGGGVHADLDVG